MQIFNIPDVLTVYGVDRYVYVAMPFSVWLVFFAALGFLAYRAFRKRS